jgi:hypothetical protein
MEVRGPTDEDRPKSSASPRVHLTESSTSSLLALGRRLAWCPLVARGGDALGGRTRRPRVRDCGAVTPQKFEVLSLHPPHQPVSHFFFCNCVSSSLLGVDLARWHCAMTVTGSLNFAVL